MVFMYGQWSHLKNDALRLRRRGASLRDVEDKLGIAKSTLSHWFRDVQLSAQSRERLRKRANRSLFAARKEAVKWHNNQREERIATALEDAVTTLKKIKTENKEIMELALAMLYLGEGSKTNSQTCMGNSNPRILKFFIQSIHAIYHVPITAFRCNLHLRADQNPDQLKRYWARVLELPVTNFGKPLIDHRTVGRPTYSHYKGVCTISCGRVAIQRKLMYIADVFCDRAHKTWAVSSPGRAHR